MKNTEVTSKNEVIIIIIVIMIISFLLFGFLRRLPGKKEPEPNSNSEVTEYNQ